MNENEAADSPNPELAAMRDDLRRQLENAGIRQIRATAEVADGKLQFSGIAPEQWTEKEPLELYALIELAMTGERQALERLQPHIESWRRHAGGTGNGGSAWFRATPEQERRENHKTLLIVLVSGIVLGFLIGYTLGARFGMLGFGVT